MTTTPEQIDRWRQVPKEHQRLEFKEAQRILRCAGEREWRDSTAWHSRPSAACRGGNTGISRYRGCGGKLFQSVGFRVDIEAVAHPDGRVLIFHIPSRPHGTAYHHDGKYLMRAGEALVPMSED